MPRKTKEELNEEPKKSKAVASKVTATKNAQKATKTGSSNKIKETKKVSTTKAKPNTKVAKKASTTKTKATKKASATKTKLNIKTSKKVSTIKAKSNTKSIQNSSSMEYYDLPYRYNETIVKILAQTPKILFVYWDISDFDREKYINAYGNNFFEETKPVLIIHNTTKNYSFEVEIDDFANSWYLNIQDPSCKYEIELGRRAKQLSNLFIENNYLYIASSNIIESPNNHILFEKQQNMVYFRNIKTNNTYSKNIATLQFIKNIGKIYNIYDVYHKIYNDEDIIDLNNPSSNNPTSSFKK